MFADIVDHQWLFKATRNPSLDNNRRVCPYLYVSLLFPCIDILYISILLHKSVTHSTWLPPHQLLTHSTSVLLSLEGSYCIFFKLCENQNFSDHLFVSRESWSMLHCRSLPHYNCCFFFMWVSVPLSQGVGVLKLTFLLFLAGFFIC
jgi:hypothetical protein